MKLFCLLFAALLFSTCSSPPPLVLTKPTSKEAALVRLDEELAVLSPILLTQVSGGPHVSYFVFEPAANKTNHLAQATQRIRKAPDALNDLLADIHPFNPKPFGKFDTTAQRAQLKALLDTYPDLDMGWVWLASTQQDHLQAVSYLNKAIALNTQVGYYYRQRAFLYVALKNYSAAESDYHRALKLYHEHSDVYEDLANMYAEMQDDRLYAQTCDLRLSEMQKHLARVEKFGQSKEGRPDSLYQLRELIGYGHLTKALHFIERRNNPAIGCIDLAKAVSYDVEEASDLQKKYCK
jgi:tetratricopeptide (TPR) repeat protein